MTTSAMMIMVAKIGRRMQTSASFCIRASTVTGWPPPRLPGCATTASPARRPDTISTRSPWRLPVCTRISTVLPSFTPMTFSTPAKTTMAEAGTVTTFWSAWVTISALAKAPGRTAPRSLGISASMSKVRLCSAICGDSRATVPWYTFGSPSTVTRTV